MYTYLITVPVAFRIDLEASDTRDARLEIEHMLHEDTLDLSSINWSCDRPEQIEVKAESK